VSPLISFLTLLGRRDAEALPPLTLVEQGWGMQERIGYGVIVENPDASQAMEGAQYNAAVYAADGTVLAVDAGYFGVILPKSSSAYGSVIFLPSDGPQPDRVEVQIFPGRLVDPEDRQSFELTGVNYIPGQFGDKVTGKLANPYDQPVENVSIIAILRDAEGRIVGGGSAYSDTIPAGGAAAVEVSVAGMHVATAELFGFHVSLTKIGGE
jgi:hypothetical protein